MLGGNPQALFWTAALTLVKQAYFTTQPVKGTWFLL